MLNVIDTHWREHLYEMDYLREGIGLRAIGQRDPLVEYKNEGFRIFETMVEAVKDDFVKFIFHVEVSEQALAEAAPQPKKPAAYTETGPSLDSAEPETRKAPPRPPGSPSDKVGRNDPCPCGSGKKYKKCCGA
jgi:preprotein translocase subunit SecA